MPFNSDFDWDYQHQAISEAKFAGVCGASWAFAATAAIEASHAIKTGEKLDLSEQQFIDCDTKSKGCTSGSPANAFEYAKGAKLQAEADYPYKGEMKIFDPSCKYEEEKGKVIVADYQMLQAGDTNCIKNAIEDGPVVVSV